MCVLFLHHIRMKHKKKLLFRTACKIFILDEIPRFHSLKFFFSSKFHKNNVPLHMDGKYLPYRTGIADEFRGIPCPKNPRVSHSPPPPRKGAKATPSGVCALLITTLKINVLNVKRTSSISPKKYHSPPLRAAGTPRLEGNTEGRHPHSQLSAGQVSRGAWLNAGLLVRRLHERGYSRIMYASKHLTTGHCLSFRESEPLALDLPEKSRR